MFRAFAGIVTIVIATLLGSGCSRGPAVAPLPSGAVVLAFGDSVTFGTGAAAGEDYPTQLARISGWDVRNHGIPGDTAEAAKSRIGTAIEETRPALVIVEIGGNDFLRRKPESEVKENVRAILQQIKQARLPVVLVATPRFSLVGAVVGSLPDAELYQALAKEEKVPLIPDVFADVLSKSDLKADPIHPNAAGYRVLAEGIAKGLVKAGYLAKR
jgi:acyl-CoA hydrolase